MLVDAVFGTRVDALLVVAFVVYVVSDSGFSVYMVFSASESGRGGDGTSDAALRAASSAKRAFSSD